METRNCSNTHFIQAARSGLVMKVRNIAYGKPALVFKSLKDIYEAEDTRSLATPTSNSQGKCTDSVLDKCETHCLSVVDRILQETKPEIGKLVPSGYDDEMSSDLDVNVTLNQIRKRCNKKKRKSESFINEDSNQAEGTKKLMEEGSDLDEPIISWKSKLSKTSKAKKKCMKRSVVASTETSNSITSEKNLVSSASKQILCKLHQSLPVKLEVPEPEYLGLQSITFSDELSVSHKEESNNGVVASNETLRMVEHESSELRVAEESKNCFTNEVSCEHLEHVEPLSMLTTTDEMGVMLDKSEMNFQEFLVLSPSENETWDIIEHDLSCGISSTKDQSSDLCSHSQSCSNIEEIPGKMIMTSRVQVPDITVDNDVGCMELHQEVDVQLFGDKAKEDLPYKQDNPEEHCGSSWKPNVSFKANDPIVSMKDIISDKEQPLTSIIPRNPSISGNYLEDELSISKERQTSTALSTVGERKSSLKDQTCDVDETLLTPELHQTPERLLSTRKVISPSSQERLCLALNSVSLGNDIDRYIVPECKGLLCFEKQTENKASSVEADIQHRKMTENHGGHVQVSQRKVITNQRQIIKKSQKYKGNLEDSRFSHAPPNLSTACTSTKSCSASAIAFSQQQMHDTESLAVKLLNELKSMKDIVEEKLLFEAYRKNSLKNDVDEVKAVINNATKVEETSRKWLSMMARDCTRFCKIMLIQNKVPASKNAVPRERKKIMFADEAGGKLCHVKFIEDDVTCQVSDSKNL
ncbi:Hypothetical predicted protein [Olea europaea subsp. europaea]|uniref:Uncharacterized protein n=1 Tax=Olea europaea subsp. europaea TaxID=158383 RepID=A0A8S0V1Q0_OLEEU|nr:Hypothetical predicted protein [Olea europaea subsp. europaea]